MDIIIHEYYNNNLYENEMLSPIGTKPNIQKGQNKYFKRHPLLKSL